ncbi:DUF5957 family protein [Streptomyces monticola]|uniref:DUF5957 family protein n=1 Tax=Streptomyces monticola TaxID=2666263 RepID=A0ABW2J9Y4_9ACTN
MKYVLAVLGGLVGGFVVGEMVAAAIGVTAHLAFDADMPFALKLMPLYLALAGAVAAPWVLARRGFPSGGPHATGRGTNSPYGDPR